MAAIAQCRAAQLASRHQWCHFWVLAMMPKGHNDLHTYINFVMTIDSP